MRLLLFPAITVLTRATKIGAFLPALFAISLTVLPALGAENNAFDVPALLQGIPAGYFPPGIDKAADLAAKGDAEGALKLIEKTRKGWKKPQYPDRALYLEALAQLELGKTSEAHGTLKESIKLRGSNSDALYLLGKTSQDEDERLDAFTQAGLFNRFMAVKPNDAFIERIKILVDKHEVVMATTILERSIAATPNFPQGRIELSKIYLGANRLPDAVKMLRDGLTYDTANPDLKQALARTLLVGVQRSTDRPQIEEATNFAADVYRSRPNDREAASVYAKTLIEFSKPEEAEKIINEAIKLNPDDAELKRIKTQIDLEKTLAAQLTPTAAPTAAE